MTYNNAKLKQILSSKGALDGYLRGVAENIVGDIKLSLQETSPGEVQERFDPHRFVTASKPGDPPNVDRGFLINSIAWKKEATLRYVVHDGVPHGIKMELGDGTVQARPFVRPVFVVWKKKMGNDMRNKKVWS
jgi:hypothetical protein